MNKKREKVVMSSLSNLFCSVLVAIVGSFSPFPFFNPNPRSCKSRRSGKTQTETLREHKKRTKKKTGKKRSQKKKGKKKRKKNGKGKKKRLTPNL